MARTTSKAHVWPGWDRDADTTQSDAQLSGRRWRILQAVRPPATLLLTVPPWIHTPDQYIEWLALRLLPAQLLGYFRDLDAIARRSCDLELLRLARRHLARARGGPVARHRMPPR
jgi:hypothetical protein